MSSLTDNYCGVVNMVSLCRNEVERRNAQMIGGVTIPAQSLGPIAAPFPFNSCSHSPGSNPHCHPPVCSPHGLSDVSNIQIRPRHSSLPPGNSTKGLSVIQHLRLAASFKTTPNLPLCLLPSVSPRAARYFHHHTLAILSPTSGMSAPYLCLLT